MGDWRRFSSNSLKWVGLSLALAAASVPADNTLLEQSRLTGDWAGTRATLAERGVTLDLFYTSSYQELISGEGEEGGDYGGKVDAFLNFDSEKLGLWQGGALMTHVEYRHGDARANLGNTLFSTNTAQLWPVDDPENVVATSLYLAQTLGDHGKLLLGKINPVDLLAADPFFGGWGISRFMNMIFVAPPSGLIPPVFMGAVGSAKWEQVVGTLMIFDPNDRTGDYFPGDLFSDGVNISASLASSSLLVGRQTNYTVTANYSTADSVDFSTLPPGLETSTESGAYNLSLQVAHSLGEGEESWEFHFKGAVADGNPNYVKASIIAGFSGSAAFIGRPRDHIGLGAFYYDLSDELEDSLQRTDLGDESALELYYSWSVAPWLTVTADIQYINPSRRGDDNNLVAAVRSSISF